MRNNDAKLNDDPEPKPKGRIITFYSYKGGTGRSMAVANVAWMLALSGQRVLVIDWDLEAPGIHRYFHPFLRDKELLSTEGLLDFVEKLATKSALAPSSLGDEAVDIIDYTVPLEWPEESGITWEGFGERAGIDILVAGAQGPAYSVKLSSFNWVDFYERLGGRRLLEAAKQQLREVYDYVLIDSRTGVSDTSGICTVEMPDTLVVCFTLNDQSIRGAAGIANSVSKQVLSKRVPPPPDSASEPPSTARKFRIFPIPTRVEIISEFDKRQVGLELAQKTFSVFLDHIPAGEQSAYWGSMQMAYFPFYAFEEIPAVFGDAPNETLSLSSCIRYLTSYISDNEVSTYKGLTSDLAQAERLRKEVLRWYLRPSRTLDPVARVQVVFDQFDSDDQLLMKRIVLRLVYVSSTSPSAKKVPLKDFGEANERLVLGLAKHQVVTIAPDPLRTVALTDSGIVERWDTLRRWIQAEQSFLQWRQSLDVQIESWISKNRDDSTLWRGRVLDEARGWLSERFSDLNESEREYIDACVEFALRQRRADEDERVKREALEKQRADRERLLEQLTVAQKKLEFELSKERQKESGTDNNDSVPMGFFLKVISFLRRNRFTVLLFAIVLAVAELMAFQYFRIQAETDRREAQLEARIAELTGSSQGPDSNSNSNSNSNPNPERDPDPSPPNCLPFAGQVGSSRSCA